MPRITLDNSVCQQLHQFHEPVELCDPSGTVIGRFEPRFDPSKWEIIGREHSEEELDRLANSDQKRYSTEEVLAHLRGLESQ